MSIRSVIFGGIKDVWVLTGIGLFVFGAYFYMGTTPNQYEGFSPITIGLSGALIFMLTPILDAILRKILFLPKKTSE